MSVSVARFKGDHLRLRGLWWMYGGREERKKMSRDLGNDRYPHDAGYHLKAEKDDANVKTKGMIRSYQLLSLSLPRCELPKTE